jgi:ketosteroid isomerase-like protein
MSTEITRAVVERHMTELGAGNIDAVMADYADDAIMVSNLGGLTKGVEALRVIFSHTPGDLFDSMEMKAEHYDGEVGYVAWKTAKIPMGSDTFVVRDGKIVAQTVAMFLG